MLPNQLDNIDASEWRPARVRNPFFQPRRKVRKSQTTILMNLERFLDPDEGCVRNTTVSGQFRTCQTPARWSS